MIVPQIMQETDEDGGHRVTLQWHGKLGAGCIVSFRAGESDAVFSWADGAIGYVANATEFCLTSGLPDYALKRLRALEQI